MWVPVTLYVDVDIPFNSSLEFKQSIDITVWERDGVYVSWSDNTQATQFTIQQQDVLDFG